MSLNGNLEDLPLLDIIQIVSFSKKTGYLTIRNSEGEGAIVFSDGSLVAAFTWDSPPSDPRLSGLPVERRDALIRNRISVALEQMIRLREGQFSFSLTDEAPVQVGDRDITGERLTRGLNAQELLIDLARGMDEDRRDSAAAVEASFASSPEESWADVHPDHQPAASTAAEPDLDDAVEESDEGQDEEEAASSSADELANLLGDPQVEEQAPAAPAPPRAAAPAAAAPADTELRTILLVDDEPDVREILSKHLRARGYEVTEAEDPDDAIKKAVVVGKAVGSRFVLVTDLGMPTSGGASFQGGFEVVKRIWKMKLSPPVLLMTDTMSSSMQARARQMHIASVVFKPGLSKLDPQQFEADMRAFSARLAEILPRLRPSHGGPPPVAEPAPRAPGRGGQRAAAAPAPGAARAAGAQEAWDKLALIQQHLQELRKPGDASQISMLVMRVARAFFERAVLLLVKGEELRGLGGFGPPPDGGDDLQAMVRAIAVPLTEPSVFLDAVASARPFEGTLPEGPANEAVHQALGRGQAREAALLPLIANRETIAVVYGDNPTTGRELGRLEPLEMFVNQAGVALENAFLQRKLQGMRD